MQIKIQNFYSYSEEIFLTKSKETPGPGLMVRTRSLRIGKRESQTTGSTHRDSPKPAWKCLRKSWKDPLDYLSINSDSAVRNFQKKTIPQVFSNHKLRETERLRNLKKSVKTWVSYFSIINRTWNNFIDNILWPFSLAQSAFKAKKSWNLWDSGFWFF